MAAADAVAGATPGTGRAAVIAGFEGKPRASYGNSVTCCRNSVYGVLTAAWVVPVGQRDRTIGRLIVPTSLLVPGMVATTVSNSSGRCTTILGSKSTPLFDVSFAWALT